MWGYNKADPRLDPGLRVVCLSLECGLWVFFSCSYWNQFLREKSDITNSIKTDCGQFFYFKATYKNHAVDRLLGFAWLSIYSCLCSESAVREIHWSSVGSTADFTQDLCSLLNIRSSGGLKVYSLGSRNTLQFKFSYFVKPQFVGETWRLWSVAIKIFPDFANIVSI